MKVFDTNISKLPFEDQMHHLLKHCIDVLYDKVVYLIFSVLPLIMLAEEWFI